MDAHAGRNGTRATGAIRQIHQLADAAGPGRILRPVSGVLCAHRGEVPAAGTEPVEDLRFAGNHPREGDLANPKSRVVLQSVAHSPATTTPSTSPFNTRGVHEPELSLVLSRAGNILEAQALDPSPTSPLSRDLHRQPRRAPRSTRADTFAVWALPDAGGGCRTRRTWRSGHHQRAASPMPNSNTRAHDVQDSADHQLRLGAHVARKSATSSRPVRPWCRSRLATRSRSQRSPGTPLKNRVANGAMPARGRRHSTACGDEGRLHAATASG
jgi:hypothetical protein